MNSGEHVRVDAFGLSDVGRVREENEDHFVVASLRKTLTLRHTNVTQARRLEEDAGPEALLLLVADGVGGNEAGAEASSTAAAAILEYLATAAGCFNNLDADHEQDFMERLEASVQVAHERISAMSEGRRRSATTLTMMLLLWPRAYLVHVGDSRAMFLRKGRLRKLTRDQTMSEELVDAGALTEEQAKRSRFADQLTSALGSTEMKPVIGLVDFRPGDTLLLCSDGLTKHVSDAEIAVALAQPASAEATTRALVNAALAGGGTDNVTVVVARM
jgi:serine/threonine protein phosphatase PrpC